MNKIEKLFKALSILIKKPYLLNLVIGHDDAYKKNVLKNHNMSLGLPQINLKDLFSEFNETVSPYAFLEGGSLPIDLALLKALAKKFHVKNYLEIGTWRGESVANIANIVENCYTLNLSGDKLYEMGKTQEYIDSQCYFSKNLPNVKHIRADSHKFDFDSLGCKFDMVFIDGDHHYEAIKKDTQTAFEIIKDGDSIIVWHDYAHSPESLRWEVMAGILDGCPAEKRDKIFHVSNTLCALYFNGKIETQPMLPYKLPDKYFNLNIEMKATN